MRKRQGRRRGVRRTTTTNYGQTPQSLKGKKTRGQNGRSSEKAYINRCYQGWVTIMYPPTGETHIVVLPIRERKDNHQALCQTYSSNEYHREELGFKEGEYRWKKIPQGKDNRYWRPRGGLLKSHPGYDDIPFYSAEKTEKMGDNFVILQNQGWKVIKQWGWNYPPKDLLDDFYRAWIEGKVTPPRVEAKKDTAEVAKAESKNSDKSHGGDNASKEVEDSPNEADEGQQKKLSSNTAGDENTGEAQSKSDDGRQESAKGGKGDIEKTNTGDGASGKKAEDKKVTKKTRRSKRSRRGNNNKKNTKVPTVEVAKMTGPSAVNVLTQDVTDLNLKEVRKASDLLKELIGRASQNKTKFSTKLWEMEFLMALETGDNPIPYLDMPAQKRTSRVLITPDCSGSCQNWSGLSKAFAKSLLNEPDLDVIYIENNNGRFFLEDGYRGMDVSLKDIVKVHGDFDFVFYLGDGDGYNTMCEFAKSGTRCVMFDSYCASFENPKIAVECGGGLYHVWSVSTESVASWVEGLQLVKDRWV